MSYERCGGSPMRENVGSEHGSSHRIGPQLVQSRRYQSAARLTAPSTNTQATAAAISRRRFRAGAGAAAGVKLRSLEFMFSPIASAVTFAYSLKILHSHFGRSLVNLP